MKLTVDNKGRLGTLSLFRPGSAFDASKQPDGSIRLVELVEKTAPPARLVRRNGRTLIETTKPITNDDVQRVMETFP